MQMLSIWRNSSWRSQTRVPKRVAWKGISKHFNQRKPATATPSIKTIQPPLFEQGTAGVVGKSASAGALNLPSIPMPTRRSSSKPLIRLSWALDCNFSCISADSPEMLETRSTMMATKWLITPKFSKKRVKQILKDFLRPQMSLESTRKKPSRSARMRYDISHGEVYPASRSAIICLLIVWLQICSSQAAQARDQR